MAESVARAIPDTDYVRRAITRLRAELHRVEAQIDLMNSALALTRSSEWREFENNLRARLVKLGHQILFPPDQSDSGDAYLIGFARGEAFALRSLLAASVTPHEELPILDKKAQVLRARLEKWQDVDGQTDLPERDSGVPSQ